jgi:uncharacterized DUF497 family protein
MILFDLTKDAANRAKHGVSLALAASLEWDLLVAEEDTREAYGELRMRGFAPIGETVYCVVYTERGDAIRVISLREATRKEVRAYASQI